MPENGADINEIIYLSSRQVREGGPFAYYLKKMKKKLVVQIPAGIKEGQKIRLAGMGEEGKGGGTPGDLYLKVHLTKPLLQSIKDLASNIKKSFKR
jgi:curved DNA-binding protein